MVRGLIVTERDAKLLHDLYSHTTLSFSQIHKRHFQNAAKQTVNNRITKLVKARLVRRCRVGIVIYQAHSQEIGSVFQITRNGIRFLKMRFAQEGFRDEPVRLNTLTLSHDLLLTESMDALRSRFPQARIVHGRLSQGMESDRTRLPDAVLELPDSGERVAVELELTAKSERRYLEIVNQYRLQNHYSKVLYVVSQSSIAEKLRYQITGMKMQPGLPERSTGRFYFVELNSLLATPTTATIRNGTSTELAIPQREAGLLSKGDSHESKISVALAPNH